MRNMLLICDDCKKVMGCAKVPNDIEINADGTCKEFKHFCEVCTGK